MKMSKNDCEYWGFMITKAGLNLIPGVGGALASVLGDIQSQRNEERLEEFVKSFVDSMNQKTINKEYCAHEDFIDIFYNIVNDAMKQRAAEKRTMLKNLLVSSITKSGATYDDTEEFERLIMQLTMTHFEILHVFYSLKEYIMSAPKHDVKLFEDNMKKQNIEFVNSYQSNYLDYVHDLENNNLVNGYTNTYNLADEYINYDESSEILINHKPYITSKGEALIEYIQLGDVLSEK